jgi:hypothetical protein
MEKDGIVYIGIIMINQELSHDGEMIQRPIEFYQQKCLQPVYIFFVEHHIFIKEKKLVSN